MSASCEIWTGALDAQGYGRTSSGERAHIAAYERAHGPIPVQVPRLVVRHRCHVRACVAVAHLEIGTDGDNARDRVRAGRTRNQHGAQAPSRDRRW